ncbi:MAG: hypothetical protein ACRDKT_11425 [Actinomycetota bacterium]
MAKTLFVMALVGGLFIGAISPALGEKTRKTKKERRVQRVEEAAYTAPAAAVTGAGLFVGACHHEEHVGCVAFPIKSHLELFVSIEVADESGLPVHAVMLHPQTRETVAEFCGETEKAIPIAVISEVDIWLLAGACPGGTPSVVTTGSVTATFSNLP